MKRFLILKIRYVFAIYLIVSQLGISTVQALDPATELFFSQQDIVHYSTDQLQCSNGVSITLSGNGNAEQVFNFLATTPISTNGNKPFNAIQAAAFVGNLQQEAGEPLDPTTTNSIGAFGIGQWLGGRKSALQALAQQQGKQPTELSVQLAYLKQEIEGGESAAVLDSTFQAGTDLPAVTVVIRKKYERPGEAEANDPKRIAYATAVFDKYKGNAPSNSAITSSGVSGCSSSNATQGDLVKTALGFAWDKPVAEGTAYKKDARPEYVAAMAQYSKITNDSDAINPFSDCGRFVSNVMHASNLDSNYPLVGTVNQQEYVKTSPLYQVISHPTMKDFKAGDIMISTSHTAIYTGDSQYDTVDASLGGRVPAVSKGMSYYVSSMDNVILARFIGNAK